MPHTIKLKGECNQKEVVATTACTPGHVISVLGAVGPALSRRPAFVLENDLVGGGIDDAYAIDDVVKYGVFEPGAEVYALLDAGENVAKGAWLQVAANGCLEAATGVSDQDAIAVALEAVNNSTASVAARIIVEVI